MTEQVDVSVVIAAWKAQDYIQDAIESALSQEGVSLEVIVVDDASPDGTLKVVQKLAENDARVKGIKLEENGGPSKARNEGIALAKGRYVAVLDADDAYLPDRLRKLVQAADEECADLIVDNMLRVDIDGNAIDEGLFLTELQYQQRHTVSLSDYILSNIMMSSEFGLGYLKPLFKVESLQKHHLSYDETLRNSEDYYLVADLLANKAKMVFEPFAGYAYQVAEGSISHRLTSDFTGKLVDAAHRFSKRHDGKLSADEQRAAQKHRLRLEHVHAFQQIVECIKMKHIFRVFGILGARVDAIPFVFSEFFKIAKQKIAKQI